MGDVKSHPLANNEDNKFIEKPINENRRDQTMVLQMNSEIIECEHAPTSINKHKNELLFISTDEKAKTKVKNEKCKSNKIVLKNDESIQKNSKEENACISFEKTNKVIEDFNAKEILSGKPKKSKRKIVFSLLDPLISVSLIGPLAIGFWRGIWTWMDLHTELFPSWFCFIFGAALHVIFAVFKNRFNNIYMTKRIKSTLLTRLSYHALRILYTYTFGVACNAHWRGGWIIIDDYLFMHIWITTCLMCLLLACLMVLRCVRNLIAPPLIIFIDTPSCIFQFPTRYNVVS